MSTKEINQMAKTFLTSRNCNWWDSEVKSQAEQNRTWQNFRVTQKMVKTPCGGQSKSK